MIELLAVLGAGVAAAIAAVFATGTIWAAFGAYLIAAAAVLGVLILGERRRYNRRSPRRR